MQEISDVEGANFRSKWNYICFLLKFQKFMYLNIVKFNDRDSIQLF